MEALVVNHRVVIPPTDLSWSAARASGSGGQNVNKVASKVDLRFDLPGTEALDTRTKARLRALARNRLDAEGRVVIVRQTHRDQPRNLEDARAALRELILEAMRPVKHRRPTRPSKSAKRRRLKEKRARGEKKRARGPVRSDE